ncbi:DNA-binding response regulator [Ktedonobacteria bacterium brp13]|nr:DNA-binding response regulator [Ktedonobacteria bacterium brp13]
METVLLVEDAHDLAQAILQELSAHGYHTRHAADGIQALEFHAQEPPALVILDWMLPRLDGLEVLRRLRQSSATPVLMLTARSEEIDRVLGLELGADDYLTKPFSMRELVIRVHALLRRAERMRQIMQADQVGAEKPLYYASLRLEPFTHQAYLDNELLDLGATEFSLLHLLLRSPGRAFHRSYLLDTVWGQTFEGTDRSVDTAVLRLRRKLGSLGEAIEMVWGIGYRLRSERKEE